MLYVFVYVAGVVDPDRPGSGPLSGKACRDVNQEVNVNRGVFEISFIPYMGFLKAIDL